MNRPALAILAFLVAPAGVASGQQTNADRISELAVRCVLPRTADQTAVRITGPGDLPFVRSALLAAWQAGGVQVFDGPLADSSAGAAVVLGSERAVIRYDRAGDGEWNRAVELDLRVSVTAVNGELLVDDLCVVRETDRVPENSRALLEAPAWPATVGIGPRPGFFRRILQPVIVTAATAVGVFLFFSLRSRRADDGG